MADQDPLLRYRRTQEDTDRADGSLGRPQSERPSSQFVSQQRDLRASRDPADSGDRSVGQGGRASTAHRLPGDDLGHLDNRDSRHPRDARDEPSPSRSGRGFQNRGADMPPDRSQSRGGRSSHVSSDEMRRGILNNKKFWKTVISIALCIAVFLLVLWFIIKGVTFATSLATFTAPCTFL